MSSNEKLAATILGIVDVLAIVGCVLLLVLGSLGGKSGFNGKVERVDKLEAQFNGSGKVGEDIYVITSSGKVESKEEDQTGKAGEDEDYILPDSDKKYLSSSDLEGLTKAELKIARNEIYARHGRMFDDAALREHFESKSWYKPKYKPKEFDAKGDSVFNEYEIANRDLIQKAEKN